MMSPKRLFYFSNGGIARRSNFATSSHANWSAARLPHASKGVVHSCGGRQDDARVGSTCLLPPPHSHQQSTRRCSNPAADAEADAADAAVDAVREVAADREEVVAAAAAAAAAAVAA
jgi:hypothetical protein